MRNPGDGSWAIPHFLKSCAKCNITCILGSSPTHEASKHEHRASQQGSDERARGESWDTHAAEEFGQELGQSLWYVNHIFVSIKCYIGLSKSPWKHNHTPICAPDLFKQAFTRCIGLGWRCTDRPMAILAADLLLFLAIKSCTNFEVFLDKTSRRPPALWVVSGTYDIL